MNILRKLHKQHFTTIVVLFTLSFLIVCVLILAYSLNNEKEKFQILYKYSEINSMLIWRQYSESIKELCINRETFHEFNSEYYNELMLSFWYSIGTDPQKLQLVRPVNLNEADFLNSLNQVLIYDRSTSRALIINSLIVASNKIFLDESNQVESYGAIAVYVSQFDNEMARSMYKYFDKLSPEKTIKLKTEMLLQYYFYTKKYNEIINYRKRTVNLSVKPISHDHQLVLLYEILSLIELNENENAKNTIETYLPYISNKNIKDAFIALLTKLETNIIL